MRFANACGCARFSQNCWCNMFMVDGRIFAMATGIALAKNQLTLPSRAPFPRPCFSRAATATASTTSAVAPPSLAP